MPARRQRPKKGLIDVGGYVLHGLFGVARDSDINHVRHTVSELRRQDAHLMAAWKDVTGQLASLAKTSNDRINILHDMLETQKHTVDALLGEVAAEVVELSKAASMLTLALSRFEDFVIVLDNLERLQASVEALSREFLSPTLVKPSELEHTLYLVGNMIRSYRADMRVLRNSASSHTRTVV